jgi:hypothetical protein
MTRRETRASPVGAAQSPRVTVSRVRAWVAGCALAGLALVEGPARAETDPRLATRLDAETAAAVTGVVDSARTKGLPTEPLVARALEGSSRHAPGLRIVSSVRTLAADLESARGALGTGSSSAELVAGATALAAGVPPDTLARLRAARPTGSLVVPLVVFTDLITRRVPMETAGAAVLAASRAHVQDRELMRLRERIDQDIRSGVPPGNATILRTRGLIGSFEAPPGPRPTTPGRPGSSP